MLSYGWVVREYNVSMDIHGSFIVRMYMYMSHGWVVREYNNFFYNNNNEFESRVMYAITIPYDIIHVFK